MFSVLRVLINIKLFEADIIIEKYLTHIMKNYLLNSTYVPIKNQFVPLF